MEPTRTEGWRLGGVAWSFIAFCRREQGDRAHRAGGSGDIGAVISTAGAGGDWVFLQGRIPIAMAADSLFKSVSAVNSNGEGSVEEPNRKRVSLVV